MSAGDVVLSWPQVECRAASAVVAVRAAAALVRDGPRKRAGAPEHVMGPIADSPTTAVQCRLLRCGHSAMSRQSHMPVVPLLLPPHR
jgi:hypothetical protein